MLRPDFDATELASAGWGIIFPENVDPGIREACRVLVEHRRSLASKYDDQLFKELSYCTGEGKVDFLERNGYTPGLVDPRKVPYYLLIVGDPEVIPFDFQFDIDLQYAVGRLYFESSEEYFSYCQAVVESENNSDSVPLRAAIFGVQNGEDERSLLSVENLVEPLAEYIVKNFPQWEIEVIVRELATKKRLGGLLDGNNTPVMIFTASHTPSFPPESSGRLADQGALLCSDWKGSCDLPSRIPKACYFSAADISDRVRFDRLIAFHFGCFTVGTPGVGPPSGSLSGVGNERQNGSYVWKPFISRLPQCLLSRGALAVIGNVGQPFETSFKWGNSGVRIQLYEDALKAILRGYPVGLAMEGFGQRYAEIAADLLFLEISGKNEIKVPANFTARQLWRAYGDARSFVVLGDPAARLKV